jgi:predicted nucleotidyltransferase
VTSADEERALAAAVERACAARSVDVVSAYLYGSRAEGRSHRESDLDLGILLPRGARTSSRERFELRLELTSALIGELHDNAVDLILLNDAPPLLARRIVTRGRRVYCSDEAADHAFRRDIQLRAADLEPFLRRTRAIKLRAIVR